MAGEKTERSKIVGGWHRRFHGQLVRFLSQGVSEPSDVQDLSQEVFLRLLRVKTPELVQSPKAYLYRVAIHVLDEWRSREWRQKMHSSEGLEELASTPGPFDEEDPRALVADIRNALGSLPSTYRAVLVLRWHHGMTYAEISNELSITERMVKRYIVNGYAALRLQLEPQMEEHHGECKQ